jgi:hypothetical protein
MLEPLALYVSVFQAPDGGVPGTVRLTYFGMDFDCGRSDGFRAVVLNLYKTAAQ